jgi:hypothetical protein
MARHTTDPSAATARRIPAPTDFLSREPALATTGGSWLLGQLALFVSGQADWIDKDTYDAVSTNVVGFSSFLAFALIGLLIRSRVTPTGTALPAASEVPGSCALPSLPVDIPIAAPITASVDEVAVGGPAERYAVDGHPGVGAGIDVNALLAKIAAAVGIGVDIDRPDIALPSGSVLAMASVVNLGLSAADDPLVA